MHSSTITFANEHDLNQLPPEVIHKELFVSEEVKGLSWRGQTYRNEGDSISQVGCLNAEQDISFEKSP